MEIHRQYINEWKSVNDDVKRLATVISNMMWYKSQKDAPMLDNHLNIPFISGQFPFYMETLFKDGNTHFGVDKIDVEYRIYFFDSLEQYNEKIKDVGNSEYNVDINKLTIRCGSIEGYFNYTITQEIYHELNHVFEYGMGMEKRTDLYDKVLSTLDKKDSDDISLRMAKLIYYTFPHEQDAFAHQFYGLLDSEELEGDFEQLIYNYTVYSEFINSKSLYQEYSRRNKNEVNKVLNYFKMSYETFNKRIYFGLKRLKKKLYRVYQRHMYELQEKKNNIVTESRKQTVKMLILNNYRKRYKDIDFEKGEYKWQN